MNWSFLPYFIRILFVRHSYAELIELSGFSSFFLVPLIIGMTKITLLSICLIFIMCFFFLCLTCEFVDSDQFPRWLIQFRWNEDGFDLGKENGFNLHIIIALMNVNKIRHKHSPTKTHSPLALTPSPICCNDERIWYAIAWPESVNAKIIKCVVFG